MARANIFKRPFGLLSSRRRKRRDDAELGLGVWRQNHDRFTRAVDRFFEVVVGIDADRGEPDGSCAPREELAALTGKLNDEADAVRRICVAGQRRAPTDGMTVPGGDARLGDIRRDVSKAGAMVAQAAQAALLVRVALRNGETPDAAPAVRAVESAAADVAAAEQALPQ